jgi:ParB family transcriptional regulator, chromosome partitioning protein
MIKKRGLSMGLTELLSDLQAISNTNTATNNNTSNTTDKSTLRMLELDLLQPGKYQPRREIDPESLEELANSIRKQGIIQPLVVRPIISGGFEIIAGERRWRAAQLAQLSQVPAVVREISDEQAVALSLIENIQREDLNAIDTAHALQRLIDEFSMTHEEAAAAVGKSRTTVTNLLRLLDLHPDVKQMLQHGELEMGHARTLLTLDLLQQLQTAKIIIEKGLSVRATENYVRHIQKPRQTAEKITDPNIVQLQNQLADKLGAAVMIHHSKIGKGKLIINYTTLEELDGILQHIQ